MRYLGLSKHQYSKNYYTDGHERDDVIQYRNCFLEFMESIEILKGNFIGDDMETFVPPVLGYGQGMVVMIT